MLFRILWLVQTSTRSILLDARECVHKYVAQRKLGNCEFVEGSTRSSYSVYTPARVGRHVGAKSSDDWTCFDPAKDDVPQGAWAETPGTTVAKRGPCPATRRLILWRFLRQPDQRGQ
jgi:hypothetical protein